MESLSISDPRRVPAFPLRPVWLAEETTNREANISKATKDVMDTWNAWADCIMRIFQQMVDQAEDLEVSEDEYIRFVQMFDSHPARPTLRPLENMTEHENWSIKTMPHRYLMYLHSLWNAYADKLEKTYVSIAAELGCCNLLASPFEITSTRGRLHGILRSMLGPGRLYHAHEVVAVADMSLQRSSMTCTEQLVPGIENMSIHGEWGPNMEGAEKLVVGLENLNISADIT
ncbi:hypothetical protein IMSHALPRED_010075 [Imshaugia aleurites]|uniref:Uncharacterized protein n=1 Tax=Imshaugia aleurites TaxID=172621 RepID=A0A8H3IZE7_9LECA|nr:hypothetical protein IMSHALPRED_010075 [Imshaugia aleurites]